MAKNNKVIAPDIKVPTDPKDIAQLNPSVTVEENTAVLQNSIVVADAVGASPAVQGVFDHNESDLPKDSNVIDEYMQPYLTAYPDEIVFFVSTDGQVFLSNAENDARNHQRKLDHTKELFEYFRG